MDKVTWPARSVSFTCTHLTCGDDVFCWMAHKALAEYVAADPDGCLKTFDASNGVVVSITVNEND